MWMWILRTKGFRSVPYRPDFMRSKQYPFGTLLRTFILYSNILLGILNISSPPWIPDHSRMIGSLTCANFA